MDGLGKQLQHFATELLPQIEKRMDGLIAWETTQAAAQSTCTEGMGRCHALLKEYKEEAAKVIDRICTLNDALEKEATEKATLLEEVTRLKDQHASMAKDLQEKEGLLQELQQHRKDLTEHLEKVIRNVRVNLSFSMR